MQQCLFSFTTIIPSICPHQVSPSRHGLIVCDSVLYLADVAHGGEVSGPGVQGCRDSTYASAAVNLHVARLCGEKRAEAKHEVSMRLRTAKMRSLAAAGQLAAAVHVLPDEQFQPMQGFDCSHECVIGNNLCQAGGNWHMLGVPAWQHCHSQQRDPANPKLSLQQRINRPAEQQT